MSVLKQLREAKGVLQKDVANFLGVDRTTYVKYENGNSEPSNDTLVKLAQYFDVSVDYLLGRTDESSNVERFYYGTKSVIRIPVYGSIPAGVPMEAIEDITDYEEAPADWALGGKEFFALKVKGDSMMPEYQDGDVVIFLSQPDCDNNEDCAVAINGNDWTFKRVEKLETGVLIKPLNPGYDAKFFTNEQCENLPVEVKGVFWELRRTKRK